MPSLYILTAPGLLKSQCHTEELASVQLPTTYLDRVPGNTAPEQRRDQGCWTENPAQIDAQQHTIIISPFPAPSPQKEKICCLIPLHTNGENHPTAPVGLAKTF